mgnify:CR=1 FL=1
MRACIITVHHEQLARLHLRCDRKLLRKVLNVFWPKKKKASFLWAYDENARRCAGKRSNG